MVVSSDRPKCLETGPADGVPTAKFFRTYRYARTLAPAADSLVHEPGIPTCEFRARKLPRGAAWLVCQDSLTLARAPARKISILTARLTKSWVSLVISHRGDEWAIDSAVGSLVDRDFLRLSQIILIGSPDDLPGWRAAGPSDPTLAVHETRTVLAALAPPYRWLTRGCKAPASPGPLT